MSTPFAPAVGLADAGANSDLVHELTGLAVAARTGLAENQKGWAETPIVIVRR